MAPRKQPDSLFDIAVRATIRTINCACFAMEKIHRCYYEESFQYHIEIVKNYLITNLPTDLFDALCSQRGSVPLKADPRIQLSLLVHPSITSFRKCDSDTSVPRAFWIKRLSMLTRLVELNLQQICTDDMLKVVGQNCTLLQKINAISRVDLLKSSFNASVLIRNVSDAGLQHLIDLKHLRILIIDPPRNERLSVQKTKYISQAGIRNIVNHLQSLEELRIESCDIGSTLVAAEFTCHPLGLKKINRHFARTESVRKLVKLCPNLIDLNLTHLGESDSDEILQLLIRSEMSLNRLVLSFFPFTSSMRELLTIKGCNLTDFTLWEVGNALSLNDILTIGKCCPNLIALRLITRSVNLVVPHNYKRKEILFKDLKSLYLGSGNFNLEDVLLFFMSYAKCLSNLIVKYHAKLSFDATLTKLLQSGFMHHLVFLSLDCTLSVSQVVIKKVIDSCYLLRRFTVSYNDQDMCLQKYIKDNNFDITLDSYY